MSCLTHSSQARWSGMCAGTLWHSINRFHSSFLSSRQQQDNRGVPSFFWGGDLKISRWPFLATNLHSIRIHSLKDARGIIFKIPPSLSAEVRSPEPEGNSSPYPFSPTSRILCCQTWHLIEGLILFLSTWTPSRLAPVCQRVYKPIPSWRLWEKWHFFFLIWNNSVSFQQKYPPVSRGGELLSLAVLDVDMLSLEVFPTRSRTELRRDVLKRDRERRATKQTLESDECASG